MNATVASSWRQGPVFLAGDAAHQLPPTGGFGMNTGVQDVHNLAWKLGAVLEGWADASLLDSYETERRPVARLNADRSLDNSRMVGRINRAAVLAATGGGKAELEEAVAASKRYGNFMGMDLGYHYASGAIVADGTEPPVVDDPVIDYQPTARPGHRAPHCPLVRDGLELSTIDLFDGRFTLLAGSEGGAWVEALPRGRSGAPVPLVALRVGAEADLEDPEDGFESLYGISSQGAVLVRPDGHVAWRAPTAVTDPSAALAAALEQILGRRVE